MKRLRKKATPFHQLSRARQIKLWAGVRRQIKQCAPAPGARFYTWYVWEDEMHDVDGEFLGRIPPVFYTFHIETTRVVYSRRAYGAAFKRSYELAPNRDVSIFDPRYTKRVRGRSGTMRWTPPPKVQYPELGGLTRLDWVITQGYRRIADAQAHKVHESTTVSTDSEHGIWVSAVVHQPEITIDFLNRWIGRFLYTPRNWRGRDEYSFSYADLERHRRKRTVEKVLN